MEKDVEGLNKFIDHHPRIFNINTNTNNTNRSNANLSKSVEHAMGSGEQIDPQRLSVIESYVESQNTLLGELVESVREIQGMMENMK